MKKILPILAMCFVMLSFINATESKSSLTYTSDGCNYPVTGPYTQEQTQCAIQADNLLNTLYGVFLISPAQMTLIWRAEYMGCICDDPGPYDMEE